MPKLDTIYLTQKEFDDLLDYSCSLPTGVIVGKKWKRRVPYRGEPYEWFLGEYRKSEREGFVDTVFSHIVIVGELEIDKLIKKFEERGIQNETNGTGVV